VLSRAATGDFFRSPLQRYDRGELVESGSGCWIPTNVCCPGQATHELAIAGVW